MSDVVTRFKVPRVRSPKHLARLKTLPCCICGSRVQVDPHHLKIGPEGGGTVTASDRWTVPLGRFCHHDAAAPDGVHRTGREADFWARHAIDPLALAERLWNETQGAT